MFGFLKRNGLKVRYATASETGLVRTNNEDRVFTAPEVGLFAVADGMGGGAQGELASELVCRELGKAGVGGEDFPERVKAIGRALSEANREIFDHAKACGFRQMGSTVALLAVEGGSSSRAAICHVGDSRVYRIRRGSAELMTHDHSIGEELARKLGGGRGSSVFAKRSSPLAHVLTRVIGTESAVKCEWLKIDLQADDVYLLCSDGVHDVVDADELPGLIGDGGAEDAVRRLARCVVERGAPDNYSMVMVRMEACHE